MDKINWTDTLKTGSLYGVVWTLLNIFTPYYSPINFEGSTRLESIGLIFFSFIAPVIIYFIYAVVTAGSEEDKKEG
mgnify:CR=1 FL=1